MFDFQIFKFLNTIYNLLGSNINRKRNGDSNIDETVVIVDTTIVESGLVWRPSLSESKLRTSEASLETLWINIKRNMKPM